MSQDKGPDGLTDTQYKAWDWLVGRELLLDPLHYRDGKYQFGRAFRRLLMLLALGLCITQRGRLGVADALKAGFAGTPSRARDTALGFCLGMAGMSCFAAIALALGAWEPRPGEDPLLLLAPVALAQAIGVAVLEESLFRGFVARSFVIGMGRWTGVFLSSLLFALLHFLRVKVWVEPGFDPWIGLRTMRESFGPFFTVAFLSQTGKTIGLTLIGVALAEAYLRSGALYAPIGMHAGLVFINKVTHEFTLPTQAGLGILWGGKKPEASLAAWGLAIGVMAVLALVFRSRGKPWERWSGDAGMKAPCAEGKEGEQA